jgi:hypothetical protein
LPPKRAKPSQPKKSLLHHAELRRKRTSASATRLNQLRSIGAEHAAFSAVPALLVERPQAAANAQPVREAEGPSTTVSVGDDLPASSSTSLPDGMDMAFMLRFEAKRSLALSARVRDLDNEVIDLKKSMAHMNARVVELVDENHLIVSLIEDKRTKKAVLRALAERADKSDFKPRPSPAKSLLLNIKQRINALRRSNPLFDAEYYLERNPDVRAAGIDPLTHYVKHGAAEGRDPSRFFDTKWYLRSNPDVAQSGMNPLNHFYRHGLAEGRNPHPQFSLADLAYRNAALASMSDPFLTYVRQFANRSR